MPVALKRDWLAFLNLYFSSRDSLKVLFHLVDSRHGVQQDDKELMSLYASTGCKAQYVIVLTKIDKIDGKVRKGIVNGVRENLIENGCSQDTPIIVTSSETKRGRDEVWRYLQLAAIREGAKLDEGQKPEAVQDDIEAARLEAKTAHLNGGQGSKSRSPPLKKPVIKPGKKRLPFNGLDLYVKPKGKK